MTATATDQGSRPRMRSSVPAGTTLARLRDEVIRPLWRWWAVAIAVVLVAMAPLLLGWTSGMNDDVYRSSLPFYQWVWKTWLGGHAPWWTPWMFAGHNVSGGGLFYFPNVVFGVLDAVVAFRWWVVAHLVFGTTGMFLWSWRSWRSKPGAVVSAIAYGLNGFIILHLVHMSFTIATAWVPWVFLGIDLLVDRWSVKRALVVVIPIAVIAGSTHPQILWLTLLAAGVYTIARFSRRGVGVWPWVRVGGATFAGLTLSAASLLPVVLFSRTSVRTALTQAGAFEYAAQPRDLVTSVLPYIMGGGDGLLGLTGEWRSGYPYHEVANHIGIAVMALAIIGAVFTWRSRRTIAMAILAVFALFTAVGGSTPVGGLVFDLVPYADHFRDWSRNMLVLDLGLALVAGAGVRAVLASTAIQRRRMLLGILIGSIVVTLFVLSNDLGGARVGGSDLQTVLLFALICLALLVGALLLGDDRRSASILLIAAVAVNVGVYTLAAPWTRPALTVAQANAFFDASVPHPNEPYQAPGGVSRWMSDNIADTGSEFVHEMPVINGYDPLIQADFQRLTRAYYGGYLPDSRMWSQNWLADVLRVTTFISRLRQGPEVSGWTKVGMLDNGLTRWERTPRLPEAYVVGAVEFASLDTIERRLLDDGSNFRTRVLLDETAVNRKEFVGLFDERSAGTVLEGSISDHGTANYEVLADGPGVLVMSIGYEKGWSATVNGRPVPVERANGLVLAVPVQAGLNDVHLEFTPPGLYAGMAISFATIVVLAGLAALPAIRRRRATRSAPAEPIAP